MKAFRGQPSSLASTRSDDRRAELDSRRNDKDKDNQSEQSNQVPDKFHDALPHSIIFKNSNVILHIHMDIQFAVNMRFL